MKVVLLCGGKGTRLKEHTQHIPKALVEIGDKPILWHIMKIYKYFGFNDFILALGHKKEPIIKYFKNSKEFKIQFVDTGEDTNTGGRIYKLRKYIQEPNFFVTYGDGVADINICSLLKFHKKMGKIGTIIGVQPFSQFGIMVIDKNNLVKKFKEKPKIKEWINGGFFVFKKAFFDYLSEEDILEKRPLEILTQDKQLAVYKHTGFWKCMDTFKDVCDLNEMWNNKQAKWKLWKD